MESNVWALEKIRGILSGDEYKATLEVLEDIERSFEEWERRLRNSS
ncbi:hypothetical protein [Thermococcus sp. 18S1]|nr:hypothetical protein [Thermococcus sp. 18S1]